MKEFCVKYQLYCMVFGAIVGLWSAPAAQAELWSTEVLYSPLNNCGSAGANCSGYVNERVSFDAKYNKLPKMNDGGDIVWQSRAGSGAYEISLKRNGGEITLISANAGDDTDPRINNSGEVAWMGYDGSDWEIFLYSQGVTRQITSNSIDDRYPKINNAGEIVWIAGQADSTGTIENYEVFFYSGGAVVQVTNNGAFNVQARINDAGDLMWRGKGAGSFDIFQRVGGVISQLTNDDLLETYPQMTNSGHLVWERHDGTDDEIIVKLQQAAAPVQITDDASNDRLPAINESGTVVWQKDDGNDWEIYVYSDGRISQLTDNAINDYAPQINARGDIIWLCKESSGIGVYLYQTSSRTISKLSEIFSGHYDPVPDLNDAGKVVWSGAHGGQYEITTSSPP